MADYSGSFSGSFEGNGRLLRNINYYDLKNLPRTITTFEGNSILANNALRNNFIANVKTRLNAESVISSSAQLIDEFDIRYGNELGDNLVSGSSQVNFLGLAGIPNGLVSSSAQITITESQISDLTHYTDLDVKSKLNNEGVISGSSQIEFDGISNVPSGLVSSSAQITITESQISDLVHTDISSLNDFTASYATDSSSFDSKISTERSRIDAILDSVDADKDSFAEIVTLINSVDTTNDIAFANHYTASNARLDSLESFSSSIQSEVNTLSSLTSSYLTELPLGVISSSAQITITESQISDLVHTLIPDGTISGSDQITDVITNSYISASVAASGFGSGGVVDYNELENVPSNIISSSAQISALGYLTSQTDSQTLTIAGNTLSISNGNSVILPTGGGAGGGSSIWTTGSQDPEAYTHLMTSNNLQVTGSFEVLGDLTVNGKSIFTQVSTSDTESAVQIKGRLELVEHQIDNYIASASIKIGNTKDVIDCGGFF